MPSGFEWWAEHQEDDDIITINRNGIFKSYSFKATESIDIHDNEKLISFEDSFGCSYDNTKDKHINNDIFIKGLHADMTGYDDSKFEIGEEYKIESDKLILGTNTLFHFGRSLYQVLSTYNEPTDRYFEIEVLGDMAENDNVCGSNHIKIIREIFL